MHTQTATSNTENALRLGHVHAVQGSVVDVSFDEPLPPRRQALRIEGKVPLMLEVQTHVTQTVVRCIALAATRGLSRGTAPALQPRP